MYTKTVLSAPRSYNPTVGRVCRNAQKSRIMSRWANRSRVKPDSAPKLFKAASNWHKRLAGVQDGGSPLEKIPAKLPVLSAYQTTILRAAHNYEMANWANIFTDTPENIFKNGSRHEMSNSLNNRAKWKNAI
jgi:hypothetical protein